MFNFETSQFGFSGSSVLGKDIPFAFTPLSLKEDDEIKIRKKSDKHKILSETEKFDTSIITYKDKFQKVLNLKYLNETVFITDIENYIGKNALLSLNPIVLGHVIVLFSMSENNIILNEPEYLEKAVNSAVINTIDSQSLKKVSNEDRRSVKYSIVRYYLLLRQIYNKE